MPKGLVLGLAICPIARQPMENRFEVLAIEGQGLEGDRYSRGEGSYNKGSIGKRQVTLINAAFVPRSGFSFIETRRNIMTQGVELMWLIGREFDIGDARFRGVKYCDPCLVPSALAKKEIRFADAFHDRGGLVAEVVKGGPIRINSPIIPPKKEY
jgi:hypothetical protein